jgi:hypothetical protein
MCTYSRAFIIKRIYKSFRYFYNENVMFLYFSPVFGLFLCRDLILEMVKILICVGTVGDYFILFTIGGLTGVENHTEQVYFPGWLARCQVQNRALSILENNGHSL